MDDLKPIRIKFVFLEGNPHVGPGNRIEVVDEESGRPIVGIDLENPGSVELNALGSRGTLNLKDFVVEVRKSDG